MPLSADDLTLLLLEIAEREPDPARREAAMSRAIGEHAAEGGGGEKGGKEAG